MPQKSIKIGIIIGAGSGKRLAGIFEEFLTKLGQKHGVKVKCLKDPDEKDLRPYYHSYQSLEAISGGDSAVFKTTSEKEVEALFKTVTKWHKAGVKAIFRTAINAETLYLFRQEVKAIKEFTINTQHGRKILFIRDQTEGFYANTKYFVNEEVGEITFEGKYSKVYQQEIVKYAARRAYEKFNGLPFEKWAIYKHHLFGDALQSWLREADEDIIVYQPDTGLTELHKFFDPPEAKRDPQNLVVICSNEVGDVIYESLIKDLDGSAKLMLFSKNVYMVEPLSGLFYDYQTVHGSADDKVTLNEEDEEILPYATFRIAAEIAEDIIGLEGVRERMEKAIIPARRSLNEKTKTIKQIIFSHFQIEGHV